MNQEDGDYVTADLRPSASVDDGYARGLLRGAGGAGPAATLAVEAAIAREVRRDAEDSGIGLGAASKRKAMAKSRVQKLSKHDAAAFHSKLRWYIMSRVATGEVRLPATANEIHADLVRRGDGLYKTAMNHGICGRDVIVTLMRDKLLTTRQDGLRSCVTGVHQDEIVRRLGDATMRLLTAQIGHPAQREELEHLLAEKHPTLFRCANENRVSVGSIIEGLVDHGQLRRAADGLLEPESWHWRASLDTPDRREDFLREISEWIYVRLVSVADEVLREQEPPPQERTAFLCDLVVFRPATMSLAEFKAEIWNHGITRARELETAARTSGIELIPVRYVGLAAAPDLVEPNPTQAKR
jgi:hypothetical protein